MAENEVAGLAKDVLNLAAELVGEDGSRWIKGAYALNDKGDGVQIGNPEAKKWCVVGAIAEAVVRKSGRQKYFRLEDKWCAVLQQAESLMSEHVGDDLIDWNDAQTDGSAVHKALGGAAGT